MRKKHRGQRVTVYIPDELYLAMVASLTPSGQDTPPFGAFSAFMTGLVEAWYVARIRKGELNGTEQPVAN